MITIEEAQDIVKEYDMDGDDRLNFDEFCKLMMDQSGEKVQKDQVNF